MTASSNLMAETGHYWQSPYVSWSPEIPDDWTLFVVYMRESRVRARVPAVLELLSLWGPFRPVALLSGPFADKRGVFWVALEPALAQSAILLLPRLGYAYAVDRAVPVEAVDASNPAAQQDVRSTTWRGKRYDLVRVYEEDQEFTRNRAPDMRTFLLESDTGEVRPVKGYRGSGSALSRRGLPVADARLLVNLVSPATVPVSENLAFLDPFGGVGGILIEALDRGYTVFSVDIDKRLRPGLEQLGARHYVADAAQLPFEENMFQGIATEPPYHVSTRAMLSKAFGEMVRVLAPGGRLAMLVAEWQVQYLLDASENYDFRLRLASPVNRKGTDVAVLAWEKNPKARKT
jgi:SAM-dependent methyltransferase